MVEVQSYLGQCAASLNKDAKIVSPIAGLDYGLARMATAEKNRNLKAIRLGLIDNKENDDPQVAAAKPPPRKVSLPSCPLPKDGMEYTRLEFLQIITAYPSRSDARSSIMNEAVEKKWVPVQPPAIRKAIRKFNDHLSSGGTINTFPDHPWFAAKGGRPLLDMSDVFNVSTGLSTNHGSSLGYEQIESVITTTTKKKLETNGISVLRNEAVSPCRNTVSNYGGALALLSGTSCTASKVTNKTPTRETAENSLRSSQAFAAAVGTSHYMPTEIEYPEYAPQGWPSVAG
ncbi:expressed unknown protein [Seminavis robusta]|uniref:Uncharacterized protein n=1 Tax=Seminavis robusta TaxID=568900 RepID=A0A9N8EJQ4_9STRA|nr:expressed unknown protein [Seminavis robusta]|eukprot:Sro1111_g242440.1 n/a (287) ;mRNA; f:14240-15162